MGEGVPDEGGNGHGVPDYLLGVLRGVYPSRSRGIWEGERFKVFGSGEDGGVGHPRHRLLVEAEDPAP
ncbi:MAG: hypothetical protein V3S97_02235 [Candidatus Bathyarchaeia archaeon]